MHLKIKKLDHFQICIPPNMEEEARQFYTHQLGLVEIEKPEALKANGGLWYEIADIQLHLGVESIPEKTKGHPAFEVHHLAEARIFLEGKNIPIKEAKAIPGVNRFYFYDPFGNRIELLEKK